MSANIEEFRPAATSRAGYGPAWAWVAAGTYLLLLINGNSLLNDSDLFWQIGTGRWILDHGAMPRVDIYSFTKAGEPWMSSSWLAQVIYANAYDLAGWAGPVVLAALGAAAAMALTISFLSRRIPVTYAVAIALAALVLSMSHILARPHILALPFMIAWIGGMESASQRGQPPSLWLLPLIIAWTNLHGGFVFGLAMIAPFALDALWNAEASQRMRVGLRWTAFGACALLAACITPYGWDSLLAAHKILDLGDLLHRINEWMPADFSRLSLFETYILAAIGAALYFGVRLSPPRILIVLGLLHMGLSHIRNIEILVFLLPLVVAAPVARQFHIASDRTRSSLAWALALSLGVSGATWGLGTVRSFSPPVAQSPAAALDALKQHNVSRILNDLPFGGYLISRGVPVFIDGRFELYGEAFGLAFERAVNLQNPDEFLTLLRTSRIDAVLLSRGTPAIGFLDHLDGWKRIYADDVAVAHVRTAETGAGVSSR